MRINIATMVDKYIGETEKNLTTIFEQARPDMQLLLFDEADSLFTKRTANVSKSNDRYSNMSVNVLLQLVERYEGVSILTTNLKNAIDPAFERRITYKVYFPMPKQPERERLWRYMCPPEIVTAEPIDYEWLSELEMSGGEIKNAVLTAAFIAATQGELLNSENLYNAGVAEAVAAGRVLRRYESGEDFHD
jgi:SpoVK/Ycf46/Vps4 family AAA+-type ATPase